MTKKMFSTIVFFGAIWGLLEATLGYVLQLLPPFLSGTIMFPIAASLLLIAHDRIKNPWALIYVGIIAASIKSVNFLFPFLPPIKTYNPMIAILIQSLVMVGVVKVTGKESLSLSLISVAMASFVWRGLFLANNAINHALTGFNFPQMQSTQTMLDFVFISGAIGAVFVMALYVGYMKSRHVVQAEWRPRLGLSMTLFIVALALTYMFQTIG